MADPIPFPTDPAAERAERARRNGRHSRGPVSERGKARASRNALRHGLTARVHLLLDRDDDADFAALAGSLESELAPQGALEGFLVARLTAAMWHTGRAERMEARAFGEGPDPDPDRLRLAMRYQGSTGRELFRCLRSLHELRRRPLARPAAPVSAAADGSPRADAAAAAPSAPSAGLPSIDRSRLSVAAWGGERGGPVPPGFMALRPVQGVGPRAWIYTQDRAFPGDVPLLVYADGTVRSPEGELLEDIWSPRPMPEPAPGPPEPMPEPAPGPPEPISASRGPASAPLTPEPPPPAADDGSAEPFGGLRHGMTLEMLNGSVSSPPAECNPQRRNEPSQPIEKTREPIGTEGSATVPPSAVPGAWERLWGLAPPDPEPESLTAGSRRNRNSLQLRRRL